MMNGDKAREQLIDELENLALQHKLIEEKLESERIKLLSVCDSMSGLIYVCDPVTYQILFANKTLTELRQKNLVGGICHQEFQGLEAPCEFCTNDIILQDKGRTYKWEHHNLLDGRTYMIEDKIIKWPDGRDVRFEFAVDITHHKEVEDAIRRRLDFVETVKRISSRFLWVYTTLMRLLTTPLQI